MLNIAKAKNYGLETAVSDQEFVDTYSVESIIEQLSMTCNDLQISVEETFTAEKDKDGTYAVDARSVVRKAIDAVKAFLRKLWTSISDFVKKIFTLDKVVEQQLDATQEKLKKFKHQPRAATEAEAATNQSVSIQSFAAADIHGKMKEEISVTEFNNLIIEFLKSTKSMNGYFNSVDHYLGGLVDIKDDVIKSENVTPIYSKLESIPKVPADARAKEFDFYTIGKIGVPETFEHSDGQSLKQLSGDFNRNVPRLIKNDGRKHISIVFDKGTNLVALADKWYADVEQVKQAGRLSSQYVKLAMQTFDQKKNLYDTLIDKTKTIGDNADQKTLTNITAYSNVVRAHINYITMYINVMSYYHNAYNKIAASLSKVLDKVLDLYLEGSLA